MTTGILLSKDISHRSQEVVRRRRGRPYGLRSWLALSLSGVALLVAAWGIHRSLHSPLFVVQVIELTELADNAPVSAQEIMALAAIRVGKVNLSDLDLQTIEKRILRHPWIKSVHLEKRFPQTVSISPTFREPRALIQAADGKLSYVDQDGQVFGKVKLGVHSDLPVLSPRMSEADKILTALTLIDVWSSQGLAQAGRIDSVDYDLERGLRALITYSLGVSKMTSDDGRVRSAVEFGPDSLLWAQDRWREQLGELRSVLNYLSNHRLAVRHIWTDLGKKIVVKTSHGS